MLITFEDPKTKMAEVIVAEILPDVIDAFINKNADYDVNGTNIAEKFGLKGQYMKLHDKVMKLERPLWNGEKLEGEQPEEVLGDLIAHALICLKFLWDGKIHTPQVYRDVEKAPKIPKSPSDIIGPEGLHFYVPGDPTTLIPGSGLGAPRPIKDNPQA